MDSPSRPDLRSGILLKNQNASTEEFEQFTAELIRHRFTRFLHLYDIGSTEIPKDRLLPSLPAELEITFLLQTGHRHLFLHNLLDHLQRNKKTLPPALLPSILSWMSGHPDLWMRIYRMYPDLIVALSQRRKEWNYLGRAYDHQIKLALGSPGYYEALSGRIHLEPLRTSQYIRAIYPDANPTQQARLIEILGQDNSPENEEFIATQIHHSRKPVRQAALMFCVRQKTKSIYTPIRSALIQDITMSESVEDFGRSYEGPISWKELASLTDRVTKIEILTAITDPDDYLELEKRSLSNLNRSAVLQAAIFHRSQKTLYALARNNSDLPRDASFAAALEPKVAMALLERYSHDPNFVFGDGTIQLLKRIHPFLDEENSQRIWLKFVEQWTNLPFTLEDLDLDILALRIHPNKIKSIWEDPVLQESADVLQMMRKTLKNRLAFLKKCYD